MNSLRMVAQDRGSGVDAARRKDNRKKALDVAADATLWRGARLSEDQLGGLQDAAPFAGDTVAELEQVVRGSGDCFQGDTEAFYPVYSEDPANVRQLGAERELAKRLCGGCPVRAQCLAWSMQYRPEAELRKIPGGQPGAFRYTGDHGIWGGLCARDRKPLRALWAALREQELGETKATDTGEGDGGEGPAVAS